MRVNCIDSLDRTNCMQQLVGRYALQKQLQAMNIIEETDQIHHFPEILENYEKSFEVLGDKLSLQYGGSIAHHSSLDRTKGFFNNFVPEFITSVKRHWANNFSDSYKQGEYYFIINRCYQSFLG